MGTKFNLLILFIVSCLSLSAQEGAFNAGVRLGGGYSVNSHVDKILVSEDYYANYSFDNKGQFVPSAELFFLLLLSAKHSVLHPNSLTHCSLDDFMLVTSPLFVFCYPWR